SQTVNKYWSRMCTRTTPFGLFAASGVAEWSSDENQKSEILFSESKFNRRTRLDMHFLCQLANMMEDDPEIQCHLKYFPNSSIYIIGDDYRFLESSNSTGRTNFNISAVSKSSHLDKLLSMAKNGVTLIELMDELCRSENIGRDDAALYVSELAESQLIISEFEPSVTGEEYIKSMEATLKRISEEFDSAPARKYLDKINSLMVMLKDLDNQVLNDVERYKDICNEAQTFGFEVNPERMVQVDSFLNIEKSAISPKVQTHLLEGMSALLKCVKPYENTNIQTFIKRFTERYENREISLCEALDSETGIGYPSRLASDTSALTEDISYEIDSDKQTVWDTYENWVFRTLIDAEKQGTYEFILDDEQLSSFPEQKEELVPTIGLMFRVVDNQENIVQIESGSGSSAVNLLGRFGHGDEEIATMISELAKIEEEKNPEVIFAEIAHLPESRTGNVLQRPNLRSYEIPYLAKSTLNDEYQVSIQDLYIKIVKGNIQLHSRRLKKRVIPRLSTAHNFGRSDLPIYKFLCDLQLHEKQSIIAFNWGSAKDKFVFFPRVKYKKAILHRATWRFKREHIAELVNTKDNGERMNKVFEFRSLWQLPRYVVLADGDNELHVDLFAEDDIKMLIDAVKKREDFIIKEFLGQQNSVIRDANNASYTNQMVACLFNEQQTYDTRVAQVVANNPSKEVARKFAPGSEWVYYKFYCGDRIADTVLREVIRDKVKDLLGDDLIDKWFFIRYNDGQPHFRFRVHLTDIIHFSRVVAEISIAIRQLTEENIIWRVEMSTYEREMERYGKHTIELAEDIFHHFQRISSISSSYSFVRRSNIALLSWWNISSATTLLKWIISVRFRVHLTDIIH
ncbi:MAG: lantibiotic dehydratase, partial [Bacteroidota bacterium]